MYVAASPKRVSRTANKRKREDPGGRIFPTVLPEWGRQGKCVGRLALSLRPRRRRRARARRARCHRPRGARRGDGRNDRKAAAHGTNALVLELRKGHELTHP